MPTERSARWHASSRTETQYMSKPGVAEFVVVGIRDDQNDSPRAEGHTPTPHTCQRTLRCRLDLPYNDGEPGLFVDVRNPSASPQGWLRSSAVLGAVCKGAW